MLKNKFKNVGQNVLNIEQKQLEFRSMTGNKIIDINK